MLLRLCTSQLLLLLLLVCACSGHVTPAIFSPEEALSNPGSVAAEAHERRCASLEECIPGSVVREKGEVDAMRERLRCLGEEGRWEYHPQPRPLPWNAEGLDFCDARWVHKHRDHIAGPPADDVTSESEWNIREGLKYEWAVPTKCGPWRPFNRSSFCETIQRLGGPLVLIGDSLTRNMFDSLHNHLHMSTNGSTNRSVVFVPWVCRDWEKRGLMPEIRKLCTAMDGCPHVIYRARNDRLTLAQEYPQASGNEFLLPWMRLIKTWGAKAVLLNRGAHITPTQDFVEELDASLRMLREEHPDLLILYRNTPPGHLNCESSHLPLDKPQDRSALPFGWGDFHEQNEFARKLVHKYGGVYLDVDTMTSLRADGHRGYAYRKHDCLHYCNPGPVDAWVRLLFNVLELLD